MLTETNWTISDQQQLGKIFKAEHKYESRKVVDIPVPLWQPTMVALAHTETSQVSCDYEECKQSASIYIFLTDFWKIIVLHFMFMVSMW
jgi:hypothetical protein